MSNFKGEEKISWPGEFKAVRVVKKRGLTRDHVAEIEGFLGIKKHKAVQEGQQVAREEQPLVSEPKGQPSQLRIQEQASVGQEDNKAPKKKVPEKELSVNESKKPESKEKVSWCEWLSQLCCHSGGRGVS